MMGLTNQQAREKKGWKAIQADYDYVLSLSDRKCSYCLTDQQVAIVLAVAESFHWPTRWFSSTQDVNTDIIDALASGLEKALMSGCCDDNLPIQYRYTEDGVYQRSLNGGGSWVDAPEYDPRVYSPLFPKPPGEPGDDMKCAAAASAALLIKEQIGDQLTDDMSRYTLAETIKDWISIYIETTNPLFTFVTVVVNQIFALVISAVRAALTEEVYEKFQCALYCSIGEDATFNDAQWAEARSQITTRIPGIAGVFLEHLVYLLGTKGITNLARSGAVAEGDCSECSCSDCDTVMPNTSGYSTFISFDEETCKYTFESVVSVIYPGEQFLGVDFGEGCAHINDVTIDSGGNTSGILFPWGYLLCGDSTETTNYSLPPNVNVNYVYFRTNDVTRISFTATPS